MMMDEIFIAEMEALFESVHSLTLANPVVDDAMLAEIRGMVEEVAERYQLSVDALFANILGLLESDE